MLRPLWQKVTTKTAQITGPIFSLMLSMCLWFAPIPNVTYPCERLLHTLFSAVQWVIALNWSTQIAPWSQIFYRMESLKLMERIYYTMKDFMLACHKKYVLEPSPNHQIVTFIADPFYSDCQPRYKGLSNSH